MSTSNKKILKKFLILSMFTLSSGYALGAPAPTIAPELNPTPKYIFYFIGDGMSFPQATSLGIYRGTMDHNFVGTNKNPTPKNPPKAELPIFTKFPVLGAATTYDASKFVTDSAAAATALATGYKALDGGVGVDAFNNSHPSIAKLLKEQNSFKIGVVSSVSIDHATPAGFYAHQTHRNKYYEIGLDLIKSDFDYFGGGGFKKPTGDDGKKTHLVDLAKKAGYTFVNTNQDFKTLKQSKSQKVLAINAILDVPSDAALNYSIDKSAEDLTLADYTKKGIELLHNDTGFFMMVEGGKIDWAAHANDAATLIHDVKALEDAVQVAVDFYNQHPNETLIVVTGDHETGGFSMGFGATGYDTYFSLLSSQTISGQKYSRDYVAKYRDQHIGFEQVLNDLDPLFGLYMKDSKEAKKNPRAVLNDYEIALIHKGYLESMVPYKERMFRNTDEYKSHWSYYDHEPLQIAVTHVLNNKAGTGWTTTAHTGLPAAVYALGIGQEKFAGFYDNTDIPKKMMELTLKK